jgi:RNA 2',3'-cyclic 3'-phosphodiesterase
MKRRLFVGLALDAPAREACARAATQLHDTGFAAKYEDAAKLHVTLAFLGNVDPQAVPKIQSVLDEAVASTAPFSVTLDKLGAFPQERRPRVVFVGAREQGAAYRALAHAVQSAYRALGFAFEDDPVAHVTIARVKDPRRALPSVELTPATLHVAAVSLFESVFEKAQNTSRYDVLTSAALLAG